MNFKVAFLQTKIDCDALIAIANERKAVLKRRRLTLEQKKGIISKACVNIETVLQSVNAKIVDVEIEIADFPDNVKKSAAIGKKAKLEYKRFIQTKLKRNYSNIQQLKTELDISYIDLEIQEKDAFIAEVNERKGNL